MSSSRQQPTRFDKRNIASYYCFDVETHADFPGRVALSVREIVEGVVRDRDLVAKLKIVKKNFLACLLVIHKNICSRKFPAIRYLTYNINSYKLSNTY